MARPKAVVEEAPQGEIVNDRLKAFLKSNKEDHYNFEEEIYYKVSSGSLNFKVAIGINHHFFFKSSGFLSGSVIIVNLPGL